MTAVAVIPGSEVGLPRQRTVVEELALSPAVITESEDSAYYHEDRIRRGDTIAGVMARLGIDDDEAERFVRSDPAARDALRRLVPGQNVHASTTAYGQLLSLELPGKDADHLILLERREGELHLTEQPLALQLSTQAKAATIASSLFGATDEAGLPDSIAVSLAEIFGSEIDFHRDLRRGDSFRVVYEVMSNRGLPVRTGRILAAEFVNAGVHYTAVWKNAEGGKGDYYAADGRSLRRGFLRSPLEFSRVTSNMGMRFHPIQKTWKQHKGVDYGAPIGTRVRATADGQVVFAGQRGGYGNLVVLRHAGGIETAYGHLSKISVRQGEKIHQDDTVGLVGMTGASTGPHLHYEYRVAGEPRDPLKVVLPDAPPLAGRDLASFRQRSASLLAELKLTEPSHKARAE
ncbi:peptidoglycan DD-metalloendopeptidase family protein [Niveibacterium terrae]|uniref:M23 family metallopeptidase n=1 Tax=Niveibacterium terrae TaxID=3373598 RepID=UPI003A8CA23D